MKIIPKIIRFLILCFITFNTKQAVAQSIPGLVAYWNFDDTTALDRSGNGNNGNIMGNPTFVLGPCGLAIQFNGVDDHIRIPKSPKLTGLTQMTLSYWIKYYHIGSDVGNTIGNGSDDRPSTPGFYTYSWPTRIEHILGLQPNGRGVTIPYNATIPLNQQEFSFIVFVVTNDTLKAYRNGCLIEAISRDNWNLARDWDWLIGWSGDNSGDSKFLEGIMDEIRIYDRPLTDSEILSLYLQCGGIRLNTQYPDRELCQGKEITLNGAVVGGTRPYSYSWSPAIGLNSTTIATPLASPTSTTTYTLTVTDAAGCSISQSVQVRIIDCDTGNVDYSFYLSSLCPGTSRREYIRFRNYRYDSRITDVKFIGENSQSLSLDTTVPLIVPPTRDIFILVIHRGIFSGTRTAIMVLTSATGEKHKVKLISEVGISTEPIFSIKTIYVGRRNERLDTCVIMTNIDSVSITITDTAWINGSLGSRLLSPSLPITIPSGKSEQFCFRIPQGNSNDTLMFGGINYAGKCPMCVSHRLVIDRVSPIPIPPISAVDYLNSDLYNLTIYPNPAQQQAILSFTLDKTDFVSINIIDQKGIKILSPISYTRLNKGRYNIQLDTQSLQSGIYHIQLVGEHIYMHATLLIIR